MVNWGWLQEELWSLNSRQETFHLGNVGQKEGGKGQREGT